MFFAGSRDDPPGKEGLTALSAALMAKAKQSLSAAELGRTLLLWAAELDVQVDKEAVVFSGRVHRDHAERFLPLFGKVLRAPRLAEVDFERVRAQHTPGETVQGLSSITLDDVRAHIPRVFTRDGVIRGVGGAPSEKAVAYLRGELEELPASSEPRPPLPVPPSLLHTRALLVEKSAAGTPLSLGYVLDVDRAHPDVPALRLAKAHFGEHRERIGVLFLRMREARGPNFGDDTHMEHFVEAPGTKLERTNIPRRQQRFSIWIRPVEHRNRLFALRLAAFELERLVEAGIPDDARLEEVKRFLLSQMVRKEQQPMRRLGYALDDAFYGSSREALKKRIFGLTRDEASAAIRRHLRKDRLQIVAVTEGADELASQLVRDVPSPIFDAADKPEALLEEDAAFAPYDLGLEEGRIRIVRPEDLFER